MLNRIVGLGSAAPATEADVDEALAAMGAGVTFYVAVAPGARPASLPEWLQARGLQPGWGWITFRRGVSRAGVGGHDATGGRGPHDRRCAGVRPRRARRVRAPRGDRAAARGTRDAGWRCWVAFDRDEPAAAGALFAAQGVAYLGLAATVAAHRGKGAQTALLAARIRQAAELGCDLVITETGERGEDRPSNSYRNILRAGFREEAVTANWLGRS